MQSDLDRAFQHCEQIARNSGSNFFLAFRTLPRSMFEEMCALYAFMRHTDDISDHPAIPLSERESQLDQWQLKLDQGLAGEKVDDLILQAMTETVIRRSIPRRYLFEAIDGVRSDLLPRTIKTFEELEGYCFQVAGVVGLCSVHIWGFEGDEPYAESVACGTAFQLTNILRDLAEDAAMGRVYLPDSELEKFGYRAVDFAAGRLTPQFRELMHFQVERAKGYYAAARPLKKQLSPAGKRIFSALFDLYESLLREIERANYDVYSRRIRIPYWKKAQIGLRLMLSGNKSR